MWNLRSAIAVLSLLSVTQHVEALLAEDEARGLLKGHSLSEDEDEPETYWHSAGSFMANAATCVMSPGIPDRVGFLSSKYPVTTSSFTVELMLRATPAQVLGPSDDGFAVFYKHYEPSESNRRFDAMFSVMHDERKLGDKTWYADFLNLGGTLLGGSGRFDGVGIVFADAQDGSRTPTISIILNDNSQDVRSGGSLVPAPDALRYNWRSGQWTKLEIVFEPQRVTVRVDGQSISKDVGVKAGRFLELTSYSGTKTRPDDVTERSTKVEIKYMKTWNNDRSTQGESVPAYVPHGHAKREEETSRNMQKMQEASSHADFRHSSQIIRVMKMAFLQSVMRQKGHLKHATAVIEALNQKLTVMEKAFDELEAAVFSTASSAVKDQLKTLENDISQMRTKAAGASSGDDAIQELRSGLSKADGQVDADYLGEAVTYIDELSSSALSNLLTQHQKIIGLSLACLAFMLVAGLALYNKFKCWEKKNIL